MVFLVIMAMFGLATGASAEPQDKPAVSTSGQALRAAPEIADSLGGASADLGNQLRSSDSSCYGGLEQSGTAELTVHIVDRADCVSVKSRAARPSISAGTVSVKTAPAAYSLVALEAKRDLVTKNIASLQAGGAGLSNWGVDVKTNRLHIGVAELTQAVQQRISSLLGGLADVELTQDAGWTQTADRIVDVAPWYGGDRIVGPVGPCTSGFSVFEPSNGDRTFNTTAAHCGYGTFKQGGNGYGITYVGNYTEGGPTDAQLVTTYPASAAGRVYTTSNGSSPVKGWISSQVGGNKVCSDGSYTGEHCGGTINATDQCLYFMDSRKTICKLIVVYSPGFQPIPGDSGGPVYNHGGTTADTGPNIYARGLITGSYGGNQSLWAYTPVSAWRTLLGVEILGG
ncbi:hypothetical protein [Frankia sp. QA3]|uniref:hypothetical protein n=1 Tax=Frankia sp. QA3 TaxID=710111 RepID=UPI0012F8864C|nr:hypothetical protein [Frankia sp. QA3]